MKREPCPTPGCKGRLRRRNSRMLFDDREEVYRDCSKGCGYRERLIVKPAVIIDSEVLRYGTTTVAISSIDT